MRNKERLLGGEVRKWWTVLLPESSLGGFGNFSAGLDISLLARTLACVCCLSEELLLHGLKVVE